MKSPILFLFALLFSFSGFGQSTLSATFPTNHYLPIGFGLSFYQSKDSYNSPNRHRGLTSKVLLGYESFSAERIQRENLSFQSGNLSNGTKNGSKLNLSQTIYHSVHGFRNQPINILPGDLNNKVNYFVGLSLKVNFSSRSARRFFQFDGAATLSFTANATYNFYDFQIENERWFYDASVSLPLVGLGFRPRYASPSYVGDLPNRKQSTIGMIYFPKHFDIDAQFNANWDMGNGNILRGGYHWWWYDSRQVHRVRMVENGVSFSLLTRLDQEQ